jgi:thiamine-phosphate pyrophosphorylase
VSFVSLWCNFDFEMKLAIISPEHDDPRETAVLGALLAAGLERYHVRKPHWPAAQLEAWLRALPAEWRSRLVLHQHHELVATFGLLGRHWRDRDSHYAQPSFRGAHASRVPDRASRPVANDRRDADHSLRDTGAPLQGALADGVRSGVRLAMFTSRSCHDLATLRAALGPYDSVFFGPVFPSISKPGYATQLTAQVERCFPPNEISSLLNSRTSGERRTTVLALGGITADRLPQIRALGFDGVAVLGAIWQAADPVAAFCEIQDAVYAHAT